MSDGSAGMSNTLRAWVFYALFIAILVFSALYWYLNSGAELNRFVLFLIHAAVLALIFGVIIKYSRNLIKESNARREIRDLYQRQEVILSAVPDIIVEVDANKKYTWANKAGIEFFGNNFIGREASCYFVGEQGTYRDVQPLFNGNEDVFYTESWQKRGDGEKRLLAWWCRVLKDERGNVTGALSSARDITGQRRTEEALAEEAIRRRILIEQSRDGIIVLDSNGKVYEANRQYADMLGYTSEEMLDLHVWDWDSQWSREELQEMLSANDEKGIHFETRHRRKDGSLLDVEISTNVTMCGGQKLVFCVCRDITERKLAEQSLRDKTRLNRILLDAFPCVALLLRPHTREIVVSNEAAVKIGAVPGNRCYSTWGGWQEPCAWCLAPEVWETGQSRRLEVENGEIVWDAYWIPVDHDLYMHFAFDITDRKKAEAEREKLEAQLRQSQKMEAVGRLAGGVAHDFNNILSIITGYTELAMEMTDTASPLHGHLNEIMEAGLRSANLVRQLLAFSRKQAIEPRPLDLNDTVAGMLNMLGRLIGEDIDLVWKPALNLWRVKLDPAQIDQMLANLAVNSRDAISGVGRILIETENTELDANYCRSHNGFVPGKYVEIAFSDNGCGMDKQTRENIFEPFFTTKRQGQGTGLGLATVYGIVKQNNGFISVYSEPGQGTTFRIYLPRLKSVTTDADEAPQFNDLPSGTETILLVEDEYALLQLVLRILEQLGYTVLAASSPKEAIRLVEEYSGDIHALVTDMIMPDMSGRDLREHLSASNPNLKCLFMSGYTADFISHHGVIDDHVLFLQKPFTRSALATKIREVFAAH